jgi:[ribosomal protein S5]-alanine N-acetyltransferase
MKSESSGRLFNPADDLLIVDISSPCQSGASVDQRVETIETERLLLRPIRPDDLAPLIDLHADQEVMRYIGSGNPQSQQEAGEWFERLLAEAAEGPPGPAGVPGWRVVMLKSTGQWVGLAALKSLSQQHAQAIGIEPIIELGYRLARGHWGQGYATELSRALVDHAFERVGLEQLVAIADVRNGASGRVLEKVGFVFRKNYAIDGRTIRFFSLSAQEYRRLVTG